MRGVRNALVDEIAKMQGQTRLPTIPFSSIDRSTDNPIPAILNGPKFSETEAEDRGVAALIDFDGALFRKPISRLYGRHTATASDRDR